MNPDVKVTVCVVTYNQEKYIRQCLQSLVEQKTSFRFDVIVSDDCSQDRTVEIISEFSDRYPDIVKPILHKTNKGAFQNFLFVHQKATGEYIAHMDGDDYALPGKLQVQADFLDRHPDCNILWTPNYIETPDGCLHKQNRTVRANIHSMRFDRAQLIQFGTVGANSTKMYRKRCRHFEVPDFDVMDYFVNVEQVKDGYACFVGDEPLGVYRVGIGVASSKDITRKIMAESLFYFLKKYPDKRLQVNTMALGMLLADLKNRRSTYFVFLMVYFKSFHPYSIIEFLKNSKLTMGSRESRHKLNSR